MNSFGPAARLEIGLLPDSVEGFEMSTDLHTCVTSSGAECGHHLPPLASHRRSFDLAGTATSFSRNQKIFSKGERAEYLYEVEYGCIRTFDILNDGRRWISRFYLPNDIVGLDAREDYAVSAEATSPSKVRLIERAALMSQAASNIDVVRYLLDTAAIELQHAQKHKLILLKGAQERVVDFLLELKSRKQDQTAVDLPMTRVDIADYLGLSIETVSRIFTRLKDTSAISLLTSRRIVLRDLPRT